MAVVQGRARQEEEQAGGGCKQIVNAAILYGINVEQDR